ncbi:MAG: hypothetical protein ACI9Y1_001658 [Lentisphaeria bacterium]|jgi:hypothetical protein
MLGCLTSAATAPCDKSITRVFGFITAKLKLERHSTAYAALFLRSIIKLFETTTVVAFRVLSFMEANMSFERLYDESYERVLNRVLESEIFFDVFYGYFLNSSEEVKAKFVNTDMAVQRKC